MRRERSCPMLNPLSNLRRAWAPDMAAKTVPNGRLSLHHRIEVTLDGREIGPVYFRDIVRIHA